MKKLVTKVSSEQSSMDNLNNQPDIYRHVPLEIRLKPIINSLQLFGLYIPKYSEHMDASTIRSDAVRNKIHHRLIKIYSFMWLAISTFWIFRNLPSFWVGYDFKTGLTASRIIQFSWSVQCYSNTIFLIRASLSCDRLPAFYKLFDQVETTRIQDGRMPTPHHVNVRKRVIISTTVCWVLAFMSAAAILYVTLNGMNPTINDPFPQETAFSLFLFLGVWEIGAWIFPIIFNVAVLNIVKRQFSIFTEDLETIIHGNNKSQVINNIRQIRMKHLNLCKCVNILEKDIKFVVASVCITTLFLCCFIVYEMVKHPEMTSAEFVTNSGWLVINLVMLLAISIAAALVNEEVCLLNLIFIFHHFALCFFSILRYIFLIFICF